MIACGDPVRAQMREAYVTLATNDVYAVGACVLAHSLRQTGTQRELVVLLTENDDGSQRMRRALSSVFDRLITVESIESNESTKLLMLGRPDLAITLTKLHCFRLIEYDKCVFIDADCLVLENVDALFDRDGPFSASPDMGWPDCFNSGLFVFTPSLATFDGLLNLWAKQGSFDGADQGLLNEYFGPSWIMSGRLPFIYNVSPSAFYSYRPALVRYRTDVKIVHFLGVQKPWHTRYMPDVRIVKGNVNEDITSIDQEFYGQWWRILYKCLAMDFGEELESVGIDLYRYATLTQNECSIQQDHFDNQEKPVKRSLSLATISFDLRSKRFVNNALFYFDK